MSKYFAKMLGFPTAACLAGALAALLAATGVARAHDHAAATPVPAETRTAAERMTQDLCGSMRSGGSAERGPPRWSSRWPPWRRRGPSFWPG